MSSKNSKLKILTNGFLNENPVLRLVLGTCPTLATSTMASNGIGMGLAATFVLLCSNVVISALRKVIPDQVRIPCYITVIAGFVSVVQMLVKAFVPALDASLGVYLPLIVVNCISSWAGAGDDLPPRTASWIPLLVRHSAWAIGFTISPDHHGHHPSRSWAPAPGWPAWAS